MKDLPEPSRQNDTGINPQAKLPRFNSEELFAGGKVVVIVHAGREYQLRVTSGNKLILTA